MTLISVNQQTRVGIGIAGATTAENLDKCDVVYVVRPGEQNQNLKYSLRSLANLPHGKVYIAGYMPSWVTGVTELYRDQADKPDQENSNANLLNAALAPAVSDNFIFMNDDFMVLDKCADLPAYHQGSLDERIAGYKSGHRMHQAFSLIATRDELRKILPAAELFSYELHMPMLFNKQHLIDMFDYWQTTGRPLLSLRPRTFYGNLYEVKGEKTDDAKTSSGKAGARKGFISTIGASGTSEPTDDTWAELRSRFAAPGSYESAADAG